MPPITLCRSGNRVTSVYPLFFIPYFYLFLQNLTKKGPPHLFPLQAHPSIGKDYLKPNSRGYELDMASGVSHNRGHHIFTRSSGFRESLSLGMMS